MRCSASTRSVFNAACATRSPVPAAHEGTINGRPGRGAGGPVLRITLGENFGEAVPGGDGLAALILDRNVADQPFALGGFPFVDDFTLNGDLVAGIDRLAEAGLQAPVLS